ncbi:hypothetical protein E4U42_005697 [Claviceps africana]|uniref:Uncharacterized protein n=1 Tax=Claviceps africana TaxID=83212 RepID=A0A8K0J9F8_9HYPO|nr:hypothetical protein E4U42_005697 [Claviceps africana]
MQITASIALAAMAIFAGQTRAECVADAGVESGATQCNYRNSVFDCGAGTTVVKAGDNQWKVTTGDTAVTVVKLWCPSDPNYSLALKCDAHSTGTFTATCENNDLPEIDAVV